MVEGARLESVYRHPLSRVRIPVSPLYIIYLIPSDSDENIILKNHNIKTKNEIVDQVFLILET